MGACARSPMRVGEGVSGVCVDIQGLQHQGLLSKEAINMVAGGGCPNDGLSWMWFGGCANPMRIAVNRGFGGITGKSANVPLRVFESQIRIRGAGRRSDLICCSQNKQAPGLWLDSLSERPSECHQHFRAAALYMRSRQVMSYTDNLLAELLLLGTESAAETKTSIRLSNARRPQAHQVSKTTCGKVAACQISYRGCAVV